MKLNAAFSGFSVNDMAKAKDFYTRIVGLDLAGEEMGLQFRLPFGGRLFIYNKPDHKPASYTMLNLVVANIDEAVDELMSKGVEFERYPEMIPGAIQDAKGILRSEDPSDGPSIAWFKDPAGNILALLQDDQPTVA
jgi:catechol 2,3-dioxygenase-like lactoylglutathione lyase family enzyme